MNATPTQVSLALHEGEDRLLLLALNANEPRQALLLTRRLTARLINGIALVLERTNLAASKAPDDLTSDIVLMEHQGALAGVESTEVGDRLGEAEEAGSTHQAPFAASLVNNVRLTTNPNNFGLGFDAAGASPIELVLTRSDLHRFVEVLKQHAEHAGWNLQIDADWLADGQSQLTLN